MWIKFWPLVPAALGQIPPHSAGWVPRPMKTGKNVKYLLKPYIVRTWTLSLSRWSKRFIVGKQQHSTEQNIFEPACLQILAEISALDWKCGCQHNSRWIELYQTLLVAASNMWVLSACIPRQLVGLSSGQFIAMLWLHLPLELPKCPQGAIHCSCILVNSLPWTGAATCHCNVATRRRNCILHFCPASTSPTATSLTNPMWASSKLRQTTFWIRVLSHRRQPSSAQEKTSHSAECNSGIVSSCSSTSGGAFSPSRERGCGCVLCSIPQLVMPRASRNQLATVCVKLTEPQ